MLEQVGLDDRAHEQVVQFSGGMKRRLEIARGLMHSPAVLFLDEPTVGLDPQTRRSLWQSVEDLREREGVTIFMTTHYMDEAEVCDRIAVIDRGTLVALDSPANLKRSMGGDLVTCSGPDNATLAREIADRFDVAPEQTNGTVQFAIENAEEFVPKLFTSLSTPIAVWPYVNRHWTMSLSRSPVTPFGTKARARPKRRGPSCRALGTARHAPASGGVRWLPNAKLRCSQPRWRCLP